MVRKILVTTDMSKNSKAGLRFAIQLASQGSSKLIFYHVLHTPMPAAWSQEKYTAYIDQSVEETQTRLESFVREVCRRSEFAPKTLDCIVEFKPFVDSAIIEFAVSRQVECICMSTNGAGRLRRIFGTNTSEVLLKSSIPVLVVPATYRRSRVSTILYASDFKALAPELKRVSKFAAATKAKLSIIHYKSPLEEDGIERRFERVLKPYRAKRVKFYFEKYNMERSMSAQLKKAVEKFKPSVLALFTDQKRSIFEKIFPQSNSARLSFDSKRPILVFPK